MLDVKKVKIPQKINLGNLLFTLSDAVDLVSPVIAHHQQRTAYIALEMSRCGGIDEELIRKIFIAALVHDNGAITAQEKVSLYSFEDFDANNHCIKGEMLLRRVPELQNIAPIIRAHHTPYRDAKEGISSETVLASQVLMLADYIERIIDRKQYILHQVDGVVDRVRKLPDDTFHKSVKNMFFRIAKIDSFWLGIALPRLCSELCANGPLSFVEIDYNALEAISKFFRDIIDFKCPFTATHTVGVSGAAAMMATLLGFSKDEVLEMKIAGNLHDLGKLAIPDTILYKSTELTKQEFEVVKSHSYYSFNLIKSISGLEHIAEYAGYHHESLNGDGYPFSLKSENIPLNARLITVADIFTALSEDRPYRKGMEKGQIVKQILLMQKEGRLDTIAVDLLLDNYDTINEYVATVQRSTRIFYRDRFSVA